MVNERSLADPNTPSSTSDCGQPVAEDAVESSATSQQSQSQPRTALEKYCEENPSASECLIYEE